MPSLTGGEGEGRYCWFGGVSRPEKLCLVWACGSGFISTGVSRPASDMAKTKHASNKGECCLWMKKRQENGIFKSEDLARCYKEVRFHHEK